jgi:hypothetical protein
LGQPASQYCGISLAEDPHAIGTIQCDSPRGEYRNKRLGEAFPLSFGEAFPLSFDEAFPLSFDEAFPLSFDEALPLSFDEALLLSFGSVLRPSLLDHWISLGEQRPRHRIGRHEGVAPA